MSGLNSFFKPTTKTLSIFLVLAVLTALTINPANALEGITGLFLTVGLLAYLIPLCPIWGDSNPDTTGCGGPLPDALSWILAFALEAAYLYLLACCIAWIWGRFSKNKA